MAYNSPSIIEATSLQAVTELAANPPIHPNTPTQSAPLPLVLYIARVPGSRDVFLTPIKPREKVVTAEDVQSSLYYVHINTDDDYDDEEPSQRPTSVDTDASQLPPAPERMRKVPPALPRRPVPPVSPPYPVEDAMPVIQERPPSPPKHQQKHRIARKPVLSDITNSSPSRKQSAVDLPTIPRRPLPTPPDDDQPSTLHEDHLRRSSQLDDSENPYAKDCSSHSEMLKQIDTESRPAPGSLTLIRRDPGSSSQWNVASISDPPVHEVSSASLMVPTANRRTKKGGAPLYLDITNNGYTPFIQRDRPTSSNGTDSRTSISSGSSESEPPPEGVFRRRLYMPGSRYADHGYTNAPSHRKFASVSAASGESLIRQSMRNDRQSVDMSSPPTIDRRSKSYSFASPWDGTCEFSTGATGRSLKCRHRLPGHPFAVDVSELRFNLPTQSSSRSTTGEKRSSYFKRHLLPNVDSDDEDAAPSIVLDASGRIDLSLGQERAGGGFGGKNAKLGKLIVEAEGVKMLDLLVAANVGLWWRAWEKVE